MLLAQEAPGGSPLDFIQYGVLGLVIAALLLGWLWAKPAVDQIITDKLKAEAQRDALLATYESKLMPALAESTAAISSLRPVLQEVVSRLDAFPPDAFPPAPKQRKGPNDQGQR